MSMMIQVIKNDDDDDYINKAEKNEIEFKAKMCSMDLKSHFDNRPDLIIENIEFENLKFLY